jgi:prolyl oligopeptidase
MGTPTAQDEYAVGKQFPRIAEVALRSSDDGKYILARVANGDGGEFLHFMLLPDGQWHQITRFADHTSEASFGPDGTLYLLTRKDAPMGKLLALAPPAFSLASARTVVTAARSSIDGFVQAGSHLFVHYMAGGPSKLFDV